jgi:hypothetical protein
MKVRNDMTPIENQSEAATKKKIMITVVLYRDGVHGVFRIWSRPRPVPLHGSMTVGRGVSSRVSSRRAPYGASDIEKK